MQTYRARFDLLQVYSGLKGSLSWQAHPKSAWLAASNPLVTGSNGANDHAVAFAGLTNRCWSLLLHFWMHTRHIQQHAFLLLCSRSLWTHTVVHCVQDLANIMPCQACKTKVLHQTFSPFVNAICPLQLKAVVCFALVCISFEEKPPRA